MTPIIMCTYACVSRYVVSVAHMLKKCLHAKCIQLHYFIVTVPRVWRVATVGVVEGAGHTVYKIFRYWYIGELRGLL